MNSSSFILVEWIECKDQYVYTHILLINLDTYGGLILEQKLRSHWGSRVGFVLAVAGSAVGLANIWKFPFTVGKYGGAAFIIVYLLALLIIGFPVFIAEVLIGRNTQKNPRGAFERLGGKKWGWAGGLTIATGFIVSSFYSAIAGWVLGYLVESLNGGLKNLSTIQDAAQHYQSLMYSPWWCVGFHFTFMIFCCAVLYMGVRQGIEKYSKVFMPLLFIILLLLVLRGVTMANASLGLDYLFRPDWSALTPTAILAALGQAFFTMSLGQGTMITYGSYLHQKENVLSACLPALLMDTIVSILAAIAVFTIVFSVGLNPDVGPGLVFQTLPIAFHQIPWGGVFSTLFFLLVAIAAVTSEISAMEPAIAYLIDEWEISRHRAVWICGVGAFLLGIPSALSFSLFDGAFLDLVDTLCTQILIPLGGFFAVVLVGWRWGANKAVAHLQSGATELFDRHAWLRVYFRFCFKYCAPLLMVVIFLNALGVFS